MRGLNPDHLRAFAEVIGFTAAYLVASAAIIGLLTAYSAAVLKSWRRARFIGALLLGLYALLYVLLSLEAWSLLIGSILLLVRAGMAADGVAVSAVAAYGAALLAMFSFSILNAAARTPKRKNIFNALDHAAIFALIAGTYTPFCLLAAGDSLGTILLIVLWSAAILGIMARFLLRRWLTQASITLYVLMGWAGIAAAPSLLGRMSVLGSGLIVAGGVIYSAGALLYARRKPDPWPRVIGFHGIWHLFVLGGSACFVVMVWRYVLPLVTAR